AKRTTESPSFRFTIPGFDRGYRASEFAVISPDGSKVTFQAEGEDGKRRLWVRSLDSFDARPVEGTDNVGALTWSPDSKSIAFFADGKIHRVDADGGPVQTLGEAPQTTGLAWGADGVILIGSTQLGIRRISSGGGAAVQITTPDPRQHDLGHALPTFLPDGRQFLFITFTREPNRALQPHRLMAGTIGSSETQVIGDVPSQVAYAEPGYLLFVRNGVLLATPFDVDTLEFTGDPIVVAGRVFMFAPTGYATFSLSHNGVLTVQEPWAGSRLQWISRSGASAEPFPLTPRTFTTFRFTPDGSRILAGVRDDFLGTYDLWAFAVDRETATRLTYEPSWEGNPVPSRDGTRIYYSSDRAGVPDIYVKVIDSADNDALVVSEPGLQFALDVSPDDRFLLYRTTKDPQTKVDLWVVPLEPGGKPFPFARSPFSETGGRFSPDGKWIAYTSDELGRDQVYLRPFPAPGPARQLSVEGGTNPQWSADGKTMFYRNEAKLFAVDVAVNNAQPRVVLEKPELANFAVTPDGTRLLVEMRTDLDTTAPTRVMVNWPKLLEAKR
ncbi:MAG TPA: hypothetical protein VIL97_07710, partial [Thermoanaerobaculia bacterium]